MFDMLVLAIIGFISGFTGSIAGIGGGIIIVPALIYIFGISSQTAAGTSLAVMVFIAISAVSTFAKQGRIDFRSASQFIIASAPGAVIGAYIGRGFSEQAFSVFFGILMILISVFLSIDQKHTKSMGPPSARRRFRDITGKEYKYQFNRSFALGVSFCVGLLSSLFGIGGGALMVPAMIMLFSFPPHIATATSMLVILATSVFGSISHFLLGNIQWYYVLLLAPGAYVGGVIGAIIAKRLNSKILFAILRLIIFLVALRMILL
ncbi:hypothetical protein BHU72_10390 [Desulfuribacillus stibiiarsenatis]|uniref:Probable membrane transporter protein n=1 Tax=Desulfuribacillus stibiiarsenatis TaxID=1390249 RepID=A0A1E5L926_9FIRM|nr:sulfite exporter TauE/SafE family protein [Desulfuribacillus stibiiarsenatis]OEH86650.1 hypothetical protein BHU72_10390 [Desulfuribacillus stibiiarsenatis]